MSDIITVNDLNLWYGPTQALHHVTISVPEHSITALIGPSGCGKSTFLKTLDRMNDLIPGVKVEGQVLYKGQDIYAPGVDVSQLRREVGMVFQKPNPFPMSIYDNVAYGPRTHGIRNKAKLDELVEQSLRRAAIWDEVKDRLKKNALGLSGGQQQHYTIVIVTHNMQQRLCIARALAVAIMTGMRRRDVEARIRPSSSVPSMPGSITSSTTRSGFSLCRACQKAAPSVKPSASSPAERRAYSSISRMLASSSTHQIMWGPSFWLKWPRPCARR